MEIQYLANALYVLATPEALVTLTLSVFFGLIVGMLPGLTATMAVALLTGLTYKTSPDMAILSLIGVYVGAISGGCQSAILLNIPGTPASAATAQDGYPMGQQGKGGLAIFLATSASALGTLGSVIFLLFLTPLLTSFALKFGSWEFFLLAVFGIMICGQLASGGDPLKGWIAGILGLLASLVGLDGLQGVPRFSFGNIDLMAGFSLIPIMIGLFGFPEIVASFKKTKTVIGELHSIDYKEGVKILGKNWETILRSAFIGVMVGIIPGVGEDVGGWLSYWAARMRSKFRSLFGKGNPEGVVAAETGNNACIGGAIIPILSLAVPGSAPAAVLMAAFWLHGLRWAAHDDGNSRLSLHGCRLFGGVFFCHVDAGFADFPIYCQNSAGVAAIVDAGRVSVLRGRIVCDQRPDFRRVGHVCVWLCRLVHGAFEISQRAIFVGRDSRPNGGYQFATGPDSVRRQYFAVFHKTYLFVFRGNYTLDDCGPTGSV